MGFDRVEGDNPGDCDHVQQQDDQQRPRQFHARFGDVAVIRRGGRHAKWPTHGNGAEFFAFEFE